MQKKTKAGIAAAGAAALLLGGLGTTALWSDSAASSGATVQTGVLDIEAAGALQWDQSINAIVPGDTLTGEQAFTIEAVGDNLAFDLDADWDTSGLSQEVQDAITAGHIDISVDGVTLDGGTFNNAAVTLPEEDLPEGDYTLTADVVVDFDEDTPDQVLQDETLDLSDLAVTVTQVPAAP